MGRVESSVCKGLSVRAVASVHFSMLNPMISIAFHHDPYLFERGVKLVSVPQWKAVFTKESNKISVIILTNFNQAKPKPRGELYLPSESKMMA